MRVWVPACAGMTLVVGDALAFLSPSFLRHGGAMLRMDGGNPGHPVCGDDVGGGEALTFSFPSFPRHGGAMLRADGGNPGQLEGELLMRGGAGALGLAHEQRGQR